MSLTQPPEYEGDGVPVEEIRRLLEQRFRSNERPIGFDWPDMPERVRVELSRLFDFSSDIPDLTPPQIKRTLTGISSRFRDIDQITGGLHRGNILAIGGLPSSGTSTFLQNIARRLIAEPDKIAPIRIAFVSLETTKHQIVQRMLAAQAKLNPQIGRFNPSEKNLLETARQELEAGFLFLNDDIGIQIEDIVRLCQQQQERSGLDILIVDGLGNVGVFDGPRHKRVEQLKQLATDLSIAVIAGCSIDPKVVTTPNKQPHYTDLPTDVKIFADYLAVIHRPEYWEMQAVYSQQNTRVLEQERQKGLERIKISVKEPGSSGTDTAQLAFFTHLGRFDNIVWEE